MIRLCCIAIGYLCGLFQTSYIIGRMYHTDIREHGSGNAGTTNALRTLGKKAGLLTLLGDLCKPMLAYLIIYLLFHGSYPDLWKLLCMYGCAGAVLGHVFPFYLGFKRGKRHCQYCGAWHYFRKCADYLVVHAGVYPCSRNYTLRLTWLDCNDAPVFD